MSNDTPDVGPEVDIFALMVARVRAGEAIHIAGPLEGHLAQLHLADISRLRAETGLPVQVIYS